MMNVIMLTMAVLFSTFQVVTKKLYGEEDGTNVYMFNLISTIASLVIFAIISKGNFTYNRITTMYAICYGAAFISALVFSLLAIENGSLALSTLIISYSLIIPAAYGVMFLRERPTAFAVIGILLLIISLYMTNKAGNANEISVIWIIYATLSFVCNGTCATLQKVQQVVCGGKYISEFMLTGLSSAMVIAILTMLCKKKSWKISKSGIRNGVVTGFLNGMGNLFIMMLASRIPAVILYPIFSGGSIVLTCIISVGCFREKLTKRQGVGVLLGIISIVMLNL